MFLTSDLSYAGRHDGAGAAGRRRVSVPVIAAGGIADARASSAALALGASAVQIGTAYLFCPEAGVSAVHGARIAGSDGERYRIDNVFTGRPARGIVNR